MLGCSIMCDKALKTIRSKSNREENPINIALQTGIFLKAHMLGFFFFLHFSLQPQFSPRKNNLIILSRKSNWLQPHVGSSMKESHRAVVCRVCFVIWEEQKDGFMTYHTVLMMQTTVRGSLTLTHVVWTPIWGLLPLLGILFPWLWPGLGPSFHWSIWLRIESCPTEAFLDWPLSKAQA